MRTACPGCGRELESAATVCPHCGEDLRRHGPGMAAYRPPAEPGAGGPDYRTCVRCRRSVHVTMRFCIWCGAEMPVR